MSMEIRARTQNLNQIRKRLEQIENLSDYRINYTMSCLYESVKNKNVCVDSPEQCVLLIKHVEKWAGLSKVGFEKALDRYLAPHTTNTNRHRIEKEEYSLQGFTTVGKFERKKVCFEFSPEVPESSRQPILKGHEKTDFSLPKLQMQQRSIDESLPQKHIIVSKMNSKKVNPGSAYLTQCSVQNGYLQPIQNQSPYTARRLQGTKKITKPTCSKNKPKTMSAHSLIRSNNFSYSKH